MLDEFMNTQPKAMFVVDENHGVVWASNAAKDFA
jgi:hypothetical protein